MILIGPPSQCKTYALFIIHAALMPEIFQRHPFKTCENEIDFNFPQHLGRKADDIHCLVSGPGRCDLNNNRLEAVQKCTRGRPKQRSKKKLIMAHIVTVPHLLKLTTKIASGVKLIIKMRHTMKSNKDSCRRIAERVQAVERLLLNISDPSQISDAVNETFIELCDSLNSAQALIEKLSQAKAVEGFFMSVSIESKLNKINQRLTENFQTLSGALQIEQTNMLQKVYAAVSKQGTEEAVCSTVANASLTPPMLPPAPVSLPQYPQLLPTPVSRPTTPVLPSMALSYPTATMPVTYVMPPISMSTPYVTQPFYNTTTSSFIVTNNVASRPVIQAIPQGSVTGIKTVAPITLPAQNTSTVSAYVVKNAFLR